MEIVILGLFCLVLLLCILCHISLLIALGMGLLIFIFYAMKKEFSPGEVLHMCAEGIMSGKNVLISFLLIGILTALWRAAGTIPSVVCYAGTLIQPSAFLVMSFLLNGIVSSLTGTAFGTSATMGVICATIGEAMNFSPVLTGGAVVSGCFIGDRCSPVSSSALLVSELTKTNIFDNLRRMIKTAVIPFLLTALLYLFLGQFAEFRPVCFDLFSIFGREFRIHALTLIPMLVILVLSAFRVSVRKTMLLSILSAIPICLFLQKIPLMRLFWFMGFGYRTLDPELASMLNGGGIISMLRVSVIICISSAYSGIFRETGLLQGICHGMAEISRRTSPFGAMILSSFLTGAVACNQTLAIMLTKQLCEETEKDREKLAMMLENTVVVIAPLIPWSIAGAVPLSNIGSPVSSLLFSFYLYLIPLWNYAVELWERKIQRI